ncbi:MAG: hypothetical protein HY868_06855 [Chloroflexi bacterium]|nr:hypothetical protein [Chloroflexota bacterium]
MRDMTLTLLLLVTIDLVVGCSEIQPPVVRAELPPQSTYTNTPGRWEIIPGAPYETPAEESGWKYIRVPITVENKMFQYSAPRIDPSRAQLHTDQSAFNADLLQTTGSTLSKAALLEFPDNTLAPPGFRATGIYRGDVPQKYLFQARVPQPAKPIKLTMPSYLGNIPLTTTLNLLIPTNVENRYVITPTNTPVEIAGKAWLTVTSITSTLALPPPNPPDPPAHDRVYIRLDLRSINNGGDSTITVQANAIGDNGVLGSPAYDNAIGCRKAPFVVTPATTVPTTLCAILPRGTRNVYVILTGDLHAAYKMPP